MGDERKKRLRRRIDVTLRTGFKVCIDGPDEDEDFMVGTIRNLSTGGVEMESRFAQPPGTRLLVELRDHADPSPSFEGVVQWNIERQPVPSLVRSFRKEDQGGQQSIANPRRYNSMGILYLEMNEAFRAFLDETVGKHEGSAGPAEFDCEKVLFQKPEDLYWEYHANLAEGKVLVPSQQDYQPGEPMKVMIQVRPLMKAFYAEGTVLAEAKPPKGESRRKAYLVQIGSFDEKDREELFEYIRLLDENFG